MGALVFVTSELSPFTPGGIGRVIHNILRTMDSADRERSIVLLLDGQVCPASFDALFPGARLVPIKTNDEDARYADDGHHPPKWAFAPVFHWRSVVILRALRRLNADVPIDYVEFPDYAGLAFATLQEKKLRGFLKDATLTVRLHSTDTVLIEAEARLVTPESLVLTDLERKCLRDCDMVVAQLDAVAEATRSCFNIPPDEWRSRLHTHAPPVLLDTREPVHESVPASPEIAVLFTSKLQRFKRPDLFVRGVCGFLRENKEFAGNAIISAHSFNEDYRKHVLSLIPADLEPRINYISNLSPLEREALIAKSVVLIPSTFESFCLAAYEASLLGARVILNGANPAFGNETPWKDGVNCFKFDGTIADLTRTLGRCLVNSDPLAAVEVPKDPWPWARPIPQPDKSSARREEPLVSVVIPHADMGAYLPETLNSVLDQSYTNLEIVLVDNASTEEFSRLLIERLQAHPAPRLRVISLQTNLGTAAARNAGIDHASGDYVLALDPGDMVHPDFIRVAVQALESNPEFDVVVPSAGVFEEGTSPPLPGERGDFIDYQVFVGEAVNSGLVQNKFSPPAAMIRKPLLDKFRYMESLEVYEDWNLYMRLCSFGIRFIVTTDVFLYRVKKKVLRDVFRSEYQKRIAYHDLLRTAVPTNLKLSLHYLALCIHPQQRADNPAASAKGAAMVKGSKAAERKQRAKVAALRKELVTFRQSELVRGALMVGRIISRGRRLGSQAKSAVARNSIRAYQKLRPPRSHDISAPR